MSAVRTWRVVLMVAGVAGLALGAVVVLNDVGIANVAGIVLWMAGAVVLHDAVLAPVMFGASVLARRAGRRMPAVVLAIVQGAVLVAAIVTGLVLPEIQHQPVRGDNATIVPLDYVGNLGLFYAGLAVVTAAAIAGYLGLRSRRQKTRSSTDQV